MAAIPSEVLSAGASEQPALCDGERMDQRTFHVLYEATPEGFRAELIGGTVYIMPPVSLTHGWRGINVAGWLWEFYSSTPGVHAADNATVILGSASEPQPDACMFLLPAYGGLARVEGGYLVGPPELVIEVAVTSAAQDLRQKKTDYEQAGVREYLVVLPDGGEVRWLTLILGRYEDLLPDADGIYRSRVFPGLWLDAQALLSDNVARLKAVAHQGLASDEHRAWVRELQPNR